MLDSTQAEILLSENTPEIFCTHPENVRNALIQKLDEFLALQINGPNSKLRRRILRYKQLAGSLNKDNDDKKNSSPLDDNTSFRPHDGSSGNYGSSVDSSIQLSRLTQRLACAQSAFDVEAAMNGFVLPLDFLSNQCISSRDTLKITLRSTILSGLVNKPMKRRMERLLFVISSEIEKHELKTAPKSPTRTPTAPKSFNITNPGIITSSSAIKSVIQHLRDAIIADEMEASVTALSELDISCLDREPTGRSSFLANLREIAASTDRLNAKTRRRVKRIADQFESSTTGKIIASTGGCSETNVNKSADTTTLKSQSQLTIYCVNKKPTPFKNTFTIEAQSIIDSKLVAGAASDFNHRSLTPGGASDSETKTESSPSKTPSLALSYSALLQQQLSRLNTCRTSEQLEAILIAIADTNWEEQTGKTRVRVVTMLSGLIDNKAVTKGAKLRRKVSRLLERLESVDKCSSGSDSIREGQLESGVKKSRIVQNRLEKGLKEHS